MAGARRPGALAAGLLLGFAAAGGARADRVLVEGDQGASFLLYGVPDAVAPRPYANNGFAQEIRKKGDVIRVDVRVDLAPLGSRATYPSKEDAWPLDAWVALQGTPDAPTHDPEIVRVSASVVGDASTQVEAATRVVDWVSTHVKYVVDPELPTSARATLDGGQAYCVGMSNLAVAMLRTAGIPARDVHGLLAQRKEALSGSPVAITSAELHRWIEIFISDVGWVSSDPLRTCNFVDAYHIVIYPHTPDDPYDPELFRKARLRLLLESDTSFGVDQASDAGRRVLVRPNLLGRYAAAVVGSARDPDGRPLDRGVAVLVGGGNTRRRAISRGGKFSFTGMEPGVYQLKVYAEGWLPAEHDFHLGTREVKRLDATLKRP